MEKKPAFAGCRVHKLSALAPGPSLLAGIAAGANYSAHGFIANFLMGPGLCIHLRVFLILSPVFSCPVGLGVGFCLKRDLLW